MAKAKNNKTIETDFIIVKYGKMFTIKYISSKNGKRDTITIKSIEVNREPYSKLHMFVNRQYTSIEKARGDITLKISELAANGHIVSNRERVKRDFFYRG